jgi:hypothetical protein
LNLQTLCQTSSQPGLNPPPSFDEERIITPWSFLPLGLEEIPYQIQKNICVYLLNGTSLLVLQSSESGPIHLLSNKIRDDLYGKPKEQYINKVALQIAYKR